VSRQYIFQTMVSLQTAQKPFNLNGKWIHLFAVGVGISLYCGATTEEQSGNGQRINMTLPAHLPMFSPETWKCPFKTALCGIGYRPSEIGNLIRLSD